MMKYQLKGTSSCDFYLEGSLLIARTLELIPPFVYGCTYGTLNSLLSITTAQDRIVANAALEETALDVLVSESAGLNSYL